MYIHFKEVIEPLRCLDQLPPMICEVTSKPISFDSNSRLASMCNNMSVVSQSNRRSAHVAVNDWGQARPRTLIYSSASLPVSPLVIDLYISAVCSCSVHVVALTLQYVRSLLAHQLDVASLCRLVISWLIYTVFIIYVF